MFKRCINNTKMVLFVFKVNIFHLTNGGCFVLFWKPLKFLLHVMRFVSSAISRTSDVFETFGISFIYKRKKSEPKSDLEGHLM